MTREIATRTRRDLASWQKAALGLLALSVGANTLLYGTILSRDMAQAMGVTAVYISTRMTGKVEWTLQDLSNMAKIFHMTDSEVLAFVRGASI